MFFVRGPIYKRGKKRFKTNYVKFEAENRIPLQYVHVVRVSVKKCCSFHYITLMNRLNEEIKLFNDETLE